LNTSGLEANAEENHLIFQGQNGLVPKHVIVTYYLAEN
jgi:hypothetical protein